jgi:AbrB family looped-hinge helix DNA binding protein
MLLTMTYVAKVTSQGQVTIPKPIRDLLVSNVSRKIFFVKENDQIVVKPVTNFMKMKGSVKSIQSKTYSDQKADQAVAKQVKEDYASKN